MAFWSWAVVTAFGLVQATVARFAIDPDGVSYADLADAYTRGGWHALVNGVWSPLYPLFLGVTFRILHPSPARELVVIHALNFVLYLGSFGSLCILKDEIRAACGTVGLWFDVLAALLFLLMAQHYLQVGYVKPDMLVAICVFLASATILRVQRLGASTARFVALGLVLGIGYLAKATMLPVGLVFLAVAIIAKERPVKLLWCGIVGMAAFLAVCSPYIYALSLHEHRPTFSEAGRLNYIWHVNGTAYVHLSPPGDPAGMAMHPTRKIFSHPDAYEFRGPIGGSYPPWYDPTFWHDGLSPRFDWKEEAARIGASIRAIGILFFHEIGLFAVWVLLLLVEHLRGIFSWRDTLRLWRILLPAVSFFLICVPLALEPRYIAGAAVVIVLSLYGSLSLPRTEGGRLITSIGIVAVGFSVSLVIIPHFVGNLRDLFRHPTNEAWEVARGLQKDFAMGQGDAVGCVDCLNLTDRHITGAYWARLAGVKIVAEIPASQKDVFLESPPAVQAAALQAMQLAGAKLIVSHVHPGEGWQRVGQTNYFAYPVEQNALRGRAR